MITIRSETPSDYAAIYEINKLAFDHRDAEPQLVEAIRRAENFIPELSIVAEEDGRGGDEHRVVGHILFSPVHIETESGPLPALSLAPMAVHPVFQNRGIGSMLVRFGLEQCKQCGHKIVIVLGHTNFYPRFGFSSALARPLGCPFGDCGEAWMAIELILGALNGVTGKVVYPPAFDHV